MTFSASFEKVLQLGGWHLKSEQEQQLLHYASRLKHSKRHSHASWKSDDEGFKIHFLDSFLSCPKFLPPQKTIDSFLDIGSGAGIPGIIYAILIPETKMVLIDSQKRRCDFLRSCLSELKIEDRVEVLQDRAEEVAAEPSFQKQFDWVTGRALAPFPLFLEYASPFVREGGIIQALLGEKDFEADVVHEQLLKTFRLELIEKKSYHLDPQARRRWVFRFKKV